MHLPISNLVATVALFLATAVDAAPALFPVEAGVTLNEASPGVLFVDKRALINNCATSSFVNQSTGGSPKVVDCQRIATNIAGGGSWTVEEYNQHQLVQYGTCAFGVQRDGPGPTGSYKIGNSDIIDLIRDSINRFKWNGLVGAYGIMRCQSITPGLPDVSVKWGLYHD